MFRGKSINTGLGVLLGAAGVIAVVALVRATGLIDALLLILAVAMVAVVLFVFGRLVWDIYRLFVARSRSRDAGDLPPLWRDVKALGIAAQLVALALLGSVGYYLATNFQNQADKIGLELSFDFLDQPAGITIADNPLESADTVGEAITAGFYNTIRVIVVGIPLALLLGTLVGVARLSTNWLLRKLATGYVEFFRNIPPLVIIVFVWQAVYLNTFPRALEAWKPLGGWLILNNSRFALPSVVGLDNFPAFRWILLGAVIAAIGVAFWRTRVFNETGTPHHRVLWALGTFFGIGLVAFFALGGPAEFSKPMLDEETARLYSGGIRMQMPYAALLVALVIYTATHIAEIVRGSIQAVAKGQVEAAEALALSGFQRYRYVILPQAMRIAFPPLINQFLNFSKNTSLAIAIGFVETTAIINNLFGMSQPAPQLILILMLLYLTLSLVLSAIGNLINRRLQITGR